MTNENHNLPDDVDVLDQAIQALRKTSIPPGPSAEVLQRVLEVPSGDIEISNSVPLRQRLRFLKPLAKIAAVLVIGIGVIGLLSLMFPNGGNGGAGSAFAVMADNVLTARTGTYRMSLNLAGIPNQKCRGMFMEQGQRIRHEITIAGMMSLVQVIDIEQQKIMQLMPAQKMAMMMSFETASEPEKEMKDMNFYDLRKRIAGARANPGEIVTELGEQELQGQKVVVYEIRQKGMATTTIWADADTYLPIQVRFTVETGFMDMAQPMELVIDDFRFNVPLDPSLFDLQIPQDYQVYNLQVQIPEPSEQTLVEGLRLCTELTGGEFPSDLNLMGMMRVLRKLDKDKNKESSNDSPGMPSETYMQHLINITVMIGQGFTFVHALPDECDWHYAGKGVTTADGDAPVFWYRPTGSDTYRVMYGDFEIEECLPDDVPEAPQEEETTGILGLFLE